MRMMGALLRWIVDLWRQLFHRDHITSAPASEIKHGPIPLARYDGPNQPPPMHWKPCHPRTVTRFKAHMTCDAGHPIILKDHVIFADGTVKPSVICNSRGCRFHEFVKLSDWTGGEIR